VQRLNQQLSKKEPAPARRKRCSGFDQDVLQTIAPPAYWQRHSARSSIVEKYY
jgi:hypothetical protein